MRALAFVLAALAGVAIACGPPRDRDIRLARLAAERRGLGGLLDRLEDRLLVDQARVRFWQELRARHESVSAVSCASLDEHATEMARHVPPTTSLNRARVAAAAPSRPQARAPAAATRPTTAAPSARAHN